MKDYHHPLLHPGWPQSELKVLVVVLVFICEVSVIMPNRIVFGIYILYRNPEKVQP